MDLLVKGALGAMTGGGGGGGPSTIKFEGGVAKAEAIAEQAKHQLNVERINAGRQLQVRLSIVNHVRVS